jgi:hypothetical protein
MKQAGQRINRRPTSQCDRNGQRKEGPESHKPASKTERKQAREHQIGNQNHTIQGDQECQQITTKDKPNPLDISFSRRLV